MEKNLRPGERLVPDDTRTIVDYIQLLRHLFVYEYVKKELNPGYKIIDLGFGEGYGTAMLADHCAEITGVDVEEKVIEYATKRYAGGNCKFIKYDGSRLPFNDNSNDIVTSFQVIEHIDNDRAFAAEIHRVLKPGGKLFMTTPNKATRLKPGQKPFNRFHKREYLADELKKVLEMSFNNVEVHGVSATDDIHKIEFDRIKRGGIMTALLNLGVRKMIPESVDLAFARAYGRLRGQKKISDEDLSFKEKYSLDNFRVEKEKVNESLDLFAICVK